MAMPSQRVSDYIASVQVTPRCYFIVVLARFSKRTKDSDQSDSRQRRKFVTFSSREKKAAKLGAASMDEQEFRRLLDLFPVVRTRDYCAEPQRPRELTSHSVPYEVDSWQDAWAEDDMREYEVQRTDDEDPFWKKLRLTAERKMSPAEADKFCRAFQRVHKKLVNEELSIEAAKKILHARS